MAVNTSEVASILLGAGSSHVLHIAAGSTVSLTCLSLCQCGWVQSGGARLYITLVGVALDSKLFAGGQAQMGSDVLPELSSDELMPLKLCKRLKCLHIHGKDVENLDFLDVSPSC